MKSFYDLIRNRFIKNIAKQHIISDTVTILIILKINPVRVCSLKNVIQIEKTEPPNLKISPNKINQIVSMAHKEYLLTRKRYLSIKMGQTVSRIF